MSSPFKKNENLNLEGTSVKKLDPAIYVGAIISVTVGEKTVYNSEDTEASIDIVFKDNETSKEHLEQIAQPKATAKRTEDENLTYCFERLLHIANAFLSDEEMKAFEKKAEKFKDFAELAKEYSALMMSKIVGVGVEFKVVGSTFTTDKGLQGSAKIPNFDSGGMKQEPPIRPVPFITRVGSGTSIKFTKREREGNEAFYALQNSTGATTHTSSGASSEKPAPRDLFGKPATV